MLVSRTIARISRRRFNTGSRELFTLVVAHDIYAGVPTAVADLRPGEVVLDLGPMANATVQELGIPIPVSISGDLTFTIARSEDLREARVGYALVDPAGFLLPVVWVVWNNFGYASIRDIQHGAAIHFTNLITYDALYYKGTDAAAYYEAFGDIVGGSTSMWQGGSLTVQTGNMNVDAAFCLEHPQLEPGDYVFISVAALRFCATRRSRRRSPGRGFAAPRVPSL